MLAAGTLIFGAALAGSDVYDRMGSLKTGKVETKRRAEADAETFVGTSACELGDFDKFPSLDKLKQREQLLGEIFYSYFYQSLIENDTTQECRPCVQACLDGLANADPKIGYGWKNPSTNPTPDRAMMHCSLRCAERTADAVCDTADYFEAESTDGWETWAEGSNPFEDSSFSPPCKECVGKCANILTSLDFDHLDSYPKCYHQNCGTLGWSQLDVHDERHSEDDRAVILSALAAADQAQREYHSCIACCAGFEMDTYLGAYPQGETCATAQEKFGTFDHQISRRRISTGDEVESTKIEPETKYDVFGMTMTKTQLYITLAVVGALLLCLNIACWYYFCIYCCCCCCRKSK